MRGVKLFSLSSPFRRPWGLDSANLLHLTIMCTSQLILALILFCFVCQMCESVRVCTDPGRYKTAEVLHLRMKPWHRFNEMTAATMCCCQVRPRHVFLMCSNPAAFLEPSFHLQHLQPQTETWEMFHRSPQEVWCLTPTSWAPHSDVHPLLHSLFTV